MEEGREQAQENWSSSFTFCYSKIRLAGNAMRQIKWNINIVDNNSTKIITANSARHCSKCFYMLSHLTLGTLTPHNYWNNSFFRRILGGFLQGRSYLLISGCSAIETFTPHDIFLPRGHPCPLLATQKRPSLRLHFPS